jgi:quercetin dioxygenase-like cupin family protein
MSDLMNYTKEFLAGNGPIPISVFAGVSFVGDFAQLVLHRQGQFQTQLCLCKPDAEIPEHSHPNVESVLIYVTGEIDLKIGGQKVYEPGSIHETESGGCSQNRHHGYIAAGQPHSAKIGPAGGAFITCQRWIQGEPQTVEMDWQGPALSTEHAEAIR